MIWQSAYSVLDSRMNSDGVYSWSFDPQLPIDVRFYIFNGRTNLRLNRHDYFEVLYVSQGRVRFQIHTRYFNAKAGDLLVIGSTFFHRPVKQGTPPTKAVELYFLPKAVLGKDSSDEDVEYLMPFLAQDANFPHLVPARTGIPAKVLELIKLIYAKLPAKSIRSRLNARTYLKMILVLLGNHYADHQVKLGQFRHREENVKRLRPVLAYLDEHFGEKISVGAAASMVHMSKSHFIRFFRNVTGQAFVAYINHLRVAKAEWLLAATDIPIADLCQQVGFCDQSYFGTVFRRSVGMPPGRYRRQFTGTLVDHHPEHDLSRGAPANLMANKGAALEASSLGPKRKLSLHMPMKSGEFIQ